MKNALYCGVALHSRNAQYVINDSQGSILFQKRLPNKLPVVLDALDPYKRRLKTVAVESTYGPVNTHECFVSSKFTVPAQHPMGTCKEGNAGLLK